MRLRRARRWANPVITPQIHGGPEFKTCVEAGLELLNQCPKAETDFIYYYIQYIEESKKSMPVVSRFGMELSGCESAEWCAHEIARCAFQVYTYNEAIQAGKSKEVAEKIGTNPVAKMKAQQYAKQVMTELVDLGILVLDRGLYLPAKEPKGYWE